MNIVDRGGAGFRRAVFALVTVVTLGAAVFGCATTEYSSTTWMEPSAPGYWQRTGHVESVREIVRTQVGQPAAGALAGALIGGFLFGGRGPGALIGAAGGAMIGASASQGAVQSRTYQVLVRFDDGQYGMFVYANFAPFQPGALVALTPQGLVPR
jgi:outer membrane lipoprotein SlyB